MTLLEGINFENQSSENPPDYSGKVTSAPAKSNQSEEIYLDTKKEILPIITQSTFLIAVFVLLFILGVKNMQKSSSKSMVLPANTTPSLIPSPVISPVPSPTPLVSVAKDEKPKTIEIIEIDSYSVDIDIHYYPIIDSKKIGVTKIGDTYEVVSQNSEWYAKYLKQTEDIDISN